ncbi:hypothetical protein RI367_003971 [Sorochytrium milnesiophthora]
MPREDGAPASPSSPRTSKRASIDSVSRVNVPTLSSLAKMKSPTLSRRLSKAESIVEGTKAAMTVVQPAPQLTAQGIDDSNPVEYQQAVDRMSESQHDLPLRHIDSFTSSAMLESNDTPLPIADLAKFFAKISTSIPSIAATDGDNERLQMLHDAADGYSPAAMSSAAYGNDTADRSKALNVTVSMNELLNGYSAFERLAAAAVANSPTVPSGDASGKEQTSIPEIRHEEDAVKVHFSRRAPASRSRKSSAASSTAGKASPVLQSLSINSARNAPARSRSLSGDRASPRSATSSVVTAEPSSPVKQLEEVIGSLQTQVNRTTSEKASLESMTDTLRHEIAQLRERNWGLMQDALHSAEQHGEEAKVHQEWRFALENVVASLTNELDQEKMRRLHTEQQLTVTLEKLKANLSKLVSERQELLRANELLKRQGATAAEERDKTKTECLELHALFDEQQATLAKTRRLLEDRETDLAQNKSMLATVRQEWKARELSFEATGRAFQDEAEALQQEMSDLRQQVQLREQAAEEKMEQAHKAEAAALEREKRSQSELRDGHRLLDETFQKLQRRHAQQEKQDADLAERRKLFADWITEMQRSLERREKTLAEGEASLSARMASLTEETKHLSLRAEQLTDQERVLRIREQALGMHTAGQRPLSPSVSTRQARPVSPVVQSTEASLKRALELTQQVDQLAKERDKWRDFAGAMYKTDSPSKHTVHYDFVHTRSHIASTTATTTNIEDATPNSLSRATSDE